MRNARPVVTAICLLLALSYSGGCMSTRVKRVARFEPERSPATVARPAPESAAYKVKYADASGGGLRTLGGTKRIVREGDPLGFAAAPDGTLIAIAGDELIPLDKLPASARYCVWTCKEKRPTQFSKEIGKATATAATTAATGGLVVGFVTLGLADAYFESEDDEDCHERRKADEDDRRDRRLTGRGYRWVGKEGVVPPKGSAKQ